MSQPVDQQVCGSQTSCGVGGGAGADTLRGWAGGPEDLREAPLGSGLSGCGLEPLTLHHDTPWESPCMTKTEQKRDDPVARAFQIHSACARKSQTQCKEKV